jgi:acyl carrier protein
MEKTQDITQISSKVKMILVEKLGVEEPALKNNASFTDDLNLDSLDVLEAFVELEKEFGIKIPDEDAEKLTTVGSLVNYIANHV